MIDRITEQPCNKEVKITVMKVESKVHIYSIDGEDTKVSDNKSLQVRNVWNRNRLVELQVGENGEKVIVHEDDLMKAIKNATGNERV